MRTMMMRRMIKKDEINAQDEEIEENENNNGREIIVRRIVRIPQQSTRLRDYITYKVSKVMYLI
jgi:hypothetical protein